MTPAQDHLLFILLEYVNHRGYRLQLNDVNLLLTWIMGGGEVCVIYI